MSNAIKNMLKRLRNFVQRRGYDIIPLDKSCWIEQAELLRGVTVKTIVDAGANGGGITSRYREIFPDAHLYCFEPQTALVRDLRARFEGDQKVTIEASCLGNTEGEQTFYVNKGVDTSSLLRPLTSTLLHSWAQNLRVESEQRVKVLTLDGYARQHNISKIDVLKMDTQGNELQILQGATELLTQQRIDLIYTEVSYAPMYEGHALFNDVATLLLRHGYSFHFSYNYLFNGRSGKLLAADVIFVSPRLALRSQALLTGYTAEKVAA